jgi:membrane-associated protein
MTDSLFNLMRGYLAHYGYWTIALTLLLENAGIPLPGESVLLLASFLAYQEHALRLPVIILVGTVAATLGDNLGFALGHFGGRPLLDRYRAFFRISDQVLQKGERLFERFGAVTIFFARFLFGMRIIAGPLAGVLRMHWKKFALFNFLGALTWVSVIASAGYLFGRHWDLFLMYLKRTEVVLAALVLMGIYLWWRHSRNHRSA